MQEVHCTLGLRTWLRFYNPALKLETARVLLVPTMCHEPLKPLFNPHLPWH
jgi:hypothetical protein